MQFNITFKTIFEYILKKVVLCIQIHFEVPKKLRASPRVHLVNYCINMDFESVSKDLIIMIMITSKFFCNLICIYQQYILLYKYNNDLEMRQVNK